MLDSLRDPLADWPAADGAPCLLPAIHPLSARFSVPRRIDLFLPSREGLQALVQRVPGDGPGQRYEVLAPALPVHQVVIATEPASGRYEGRMLGRTEMLTARPGSLSVIPAGVESRWEGPTGHEATLVLHLQTARMAELAREAGYPERLAALAPRLGQEDPGIAALVEALRIERATHGVSALYAAQWSILVSLRLLRLDLPEPRRYALTPRRLGAVRDFAQAHLGEDIGLDELAGAAGLSRFHFARAFRRETGLSPSAWLRALRCAEARRMLVQSDLPVQAVARRCGFVSPAHFSNAFRATYGITPTRWRQEQRL